MNTTGAISRELCFLLIRNNSTHAVVVLKLLRSLRIDLTVEEQCNRMVMLKIKLTPLRDWQENGRIAELRSETQEVEKGSRVSAAPTSSGQIPKFGCVIFGSDDSSLKFSDLIYDCSKQLPGWFWFTLLWLASASCFPTSTTWLTGYPSTSCTR